MRTILLLVLAAGLTLSAADVHADEPAALHLGTRSNEPEAARTALRPGVPELPWQTVQQLDARYRTAIGKRNFGIGLLIVSFVVATGFAAGSAYLFTHPIHSDTSSCTAEFCGMEDFGANLERALQGGVLACLSGASMVGVGFGIGKWVSGQRTARAVQNELRARAGALVPRVGIAATPSAGLVEARWQF